MHTVTVRPYHLGQIKHTIIAPPYHLRQLKPLMIAILEHQRKSKICNRKEKDLLKCLQQFIQGKFTHQTFPLIREKWMTKTNWINHRPPIINSTKFQPPFISAETAWFREKWIKYSIILTNSLTDCPTEFSHESSSSTTK